MKFVFPLCSLLLALVAGALSEAQFFNYPTAGGYLRSGFEQPLDPEGRFFFGTRTLTLSTSTSTSTITTTTTCTTSTSALSTCVTGGRRRRRSTASSPLFYNDQANEEGFESVFLSPAKRSAEELAPAQPAVPEQPPVMVPFVVQPGMAKIANLHPQARFLLAFTTFTTVTTTTSTATSTLTAICSSNTSFQICGGTGK